MPEISVIFFADVVGKAGRCILSQMTRRLRYKYNIEFAIANTENAAGGFGITPEMAKKAFAYGIDCQTSGNHVWDRFGLAEYMDREPRFIRAANYPNGVPGNGYYIGEAAGHKIAVVCLMGRLFMPNIDCPFRAADLVLEKIKGKADLIIVDIHAEATSEKQALAYYLDGRVAAVIGTHTHVQTADETISAKGTAYISDVGMTGPFDSIIGMSKEAALGRFLTGMPKRLSASADDVRISGVVLRLDPKNGGRAVAIERFCLPTDLSLPLKNPEEEVIDVGEDD